MPWKNIVVHGPVTSVVYQHDQTSCWQFSCGPDAFHSEVSSAFIEIISSFIKDSHQLISCRPEKVPLSVRILSNQGSRWAASASNVGVIISFIILSCSAMTALKGDCSFLCHHFPPLTSQGWSHNEKTWLFVFQNNLSREHLQIYSYL